MGEIAEQADQSLTASRPILSRGRAVPELAAFGGNPSMDRSEEECKQCKRKLVGY